MRISIDEQIVYHAIAALARASDYLTYRDHMDAQLKLSETRLSPLTDMVDKAHAGLRAATNSPERAL